MLPTAAEGTYNNYFSDRANKLAQTELINCPTQTQGQNLTTKF